MARRGRLRRAEQRVALLEEQLRGLKSRNGPKPSVLLN